MKINPVQTPTSTSAMNNGAAKADYLDGVVTAEQVLANDPGGSIFYDFFNATTQTWLHTNTVNLTGSTDVIQEVIQIANGTYSYADVYHGGYDFTDQFNALGVQSGWAGLSLPAPVGWGVVSGSASSEIVGPGYIPFTGAYHGDNWLDTQASPGGIDITHAVQTVAGAQLGPASDMLNIVIAAQSVAGYLTDANAKVDLSFNGVLVHEFTLADFETTPGDVSTVQWNNMKSFNFNVTAADNGSGTGTIEIHDTTATVGYVGMAIDSVAFHSYVA